MIQKMKNKSLFFYFLTIILIGFISYIIHSEINDDNKSSIIDLKYSYFFNFIVSILILLSVIFTARKSFDKTGFVFMGGSILKILASILFLLPIFINNEVNVLPEIINFFVPYFIFLIIEMVFSLKVLNSMNKK